MLDVLGMQCPAGDALEPRQRILLALQSALRAPVSSRIIAWTQTCTLSGSYAPAGTWGRFPFLKSTGMTIPSATSTTSIFAMTPSRSDDRVTERARAISSSSSSGSGRRPPPLSTRAWTRLPSAVSALSAHSPSTHSR